MIRSGRFSWEMYELLVEQNRVSSKEMIKKMGDKWLCHPSNRVKRLDVPLPLLSRESKVLKRK